MARGRTADDDALAVLATSALPLAVQEVAERLRWGKSMAAKVLTRLAAAGRIELIPGAPNGGGRPSAKFSLKNEVSSMSVTPAPILMRRFEEGTIVVTPSNNEARVILHRRDNWVEVEFLAGAMRGGRVTLHAMYLRAIQPGRERPAPVRIKTPSV